MTSASAQPLGFPTRSKIQASGKYLCKVETGRVPSHEVDLDRLEACVDVVTRFREAHAAPMNSVRMGLSSMTKSENIDSRPTQRHKRVPRIVRKLIRMNGTNLANLEDIGGCRVVVADADEMDRLCRRIRKRWAGKFARDPDHRDYIANPKPMGYRARHFVVERAGRNIEVQIRTPGQQHWAESVEAFDNRWPSANLKDEVGPESVIENFQIAGEVIHRQEFGLEIDGDLMDRLRESNATVIREGWFKG